MYDARSTCQALHTVQGLLATSLRPPPTRMTRAATTRGDEHHRNAHPCSTIAFAGSYASRRRSRQTGRRGRGKRVEKNAKQNKTRKGKTKRRRGRTSNPTRYIRRDRVRIARSTPEGVGEGGHEAESVGYRRRSFMAFGFWLRDGVFGKEARQHHTGTPSRRRTPKARNAHLVRFGHVNTTAKLGVEAGWNTAEAMATLEGCLGTQ